MTLTWKWIINKQLTCIKYQRKFVITGNCHTQIMQLEKLLAVIQFTVLAILIGAT